MNGRNFDTLCRQLVKPGSRRAFVAAIGAAFFARSARAAASAAQVPAACGAAGDVCTLALGCCDGMTCATSYMNPSYGVCVSGGSGGMLPVADSVISPESDGVDSQLQAAMTAAAVTDTTTSSTTTDKQTRRDARQSKQSSRRSTRKSNNNTQQTNRKTRRDTHQLNAAPQLELQLFASVIVRDEDGEPIEDDSEPETLLVTNLDDTSIVITSISSLLQPTNIGTVNSTINTSGRFLFESGEFAKDNPPSSSIGKVWSDTEVCKKNDIPNEGAGVTVIASQTGATISSEFTVLCGGTTINDSVGNGNNHRKQHQQHARRRRKRRQQQKQHKNNGGK
jgi:hypothetical protein